MMRWKIWVWGLALVVACAGHARADGPTPAQVFGTVKKTFLYDGRAVPVGSVVEVFGQNATSWDVQDPADVNAKPRFVWVPKDSIELILSTVYTTEWSTYLPPGKPIWPLQFVSNDNVLSATGDFHNTITETQTPESMATQAAALGEEVFVCEQFGNQFYLVSRAAPTDANHPCSYMVKVADLPHPLPDSVTNEGDFASPPQVVDTSSAGSVLFDVAVFGIPVIILLVGAVWIDRGRQKRRDRQLPVSAEDLAKLYPGFAVAVGDVLADGEALFRVNNDGMRVALKKWQFNRQTGEFEKIKREFAGPRVVFRSSYAQRFDSYYNPMRPKRLGLAGGGAAVFGIIAVAAASGSIIGGDPNASHVTARVVFGLIFGFLCASCCLALWHDTNKAMHLGPEPFKRLSEDFGPGDIAAATSGEQREGAGPGPDLGYRPAI